MPTGYSSKVSFLSKPDPNTDSLKLIIPNLIKFPDIDSNKGRHASCNIAVDIGR